MKGFGQKTYQAPTALVELPGATRPVLVARVSDGYWLDITTAAASVAMKEDSLLVWIRTNQVEVREIQSVETGKRFKSIRSEDHLSWVESCQFEGNPFADDALRQSSAEGFQLMVKAAHERGDDHISIGDVRIRFYEQDGEFYLDAGDVKAVVS